MKQNNDVFNDDEFDPIKYINQKFPDENSLVNLDSEIDVIKSEIQKLDEEILKDIHEHAILNKKTKDELANTHQLTKKLIEEIKTIKEKSIESEQIVQEMCKDIKTLDLAKKNITQSINCLGKFSDLITSLDNLRNFSTEKNYKQASHILLSILDLSNYFKNYKDIPQIKEVLQNKDMILKNLKLQLNDEFSLYFKDMSNQSTDILRDACSLIEVFGNDFRKEIIKMAVNQILTPYKELFERRDQKNIETIEKRFVWFSRSLQDFKTRYSEIFPHYWGILCFIVNEFCGETSIHVSEILPMIRDQDDMVVPMIKALQHTIQFEDAMQKELKNEYEQYTKSQEKNAHKISQIPKIKGTISKCFENYTDLYVMKEEKELNDGVNSELNKDLLKKNKFSSNSDELNILNSSLIMFKKIKFLLERVEKISRGKTMIKIYEKIKHTIKFYIEQIQQQILKEEIILKKEDKFEKSFLLNICVLINTIDYTKETVNKMNDIIQNLLDEPYNQNVDFVEEEDYCSVVSLDLINSVMKFLSQKLDNNFNQKMLKQNWESGIKVSPYVEEMKQLLNFYSECFKEYVNNVYVIKILKLICEITNEKFIDNILKIRKLSPQIVQRLIIDFGEIKQQLFGIGIKNGEIISNIYNSVCLRHCEKTEGVLKLLEEENEKIEGIIGDYLNSLTATDITKILSMKGFKKTEINQIITRYSLNN